MHAKQKWEQIKSETGAFISRFDQRPGMCNQQEDEVIHMIDRVLALPTRQYILEIGFSGGGSFLIWTKLFDKIITIDKCIDAFNVFWRVYPQYQNDPRYIFLQLKSQDASTVELVQQTFPHLDCLFIDGSHLYEDVRRDYELYAPMVRKDGLIIFHDVCHVHHDPLCGVPRFVAELNNGDHYVDVMCATTDPKVHWQSLPFGHMGVGIERRCIDN